MLLMAWVDRIKQQIYFFNLTQLHSLLTGMYNYIGLQDAITPSCGGATAETIYSKLGRVAETRDVITLSKFQINWFINVALESGWSFMF